MATIVKRPSKTKGTTYLARVRLKGFPQETMTFERKTDALKWVQEIEANMRAGRYNKTEESVKQTVSKLIDRYLKYIERHNPKRIRDVAPKLEWWRSQIGDFKLSDINKAIISEKRELLLSQPTQFGATYTNSTVNRYMNALSHAFTIAVNEWEWLEHHPLRKLKNLKEPRGRVRYLSDEERASLLKACKASKNQYLYNIVVLALSTGARKGEILKIKWQDVDFKRKVITLHETKNGERRVLPLVAHAFELLISQFHERNQDTPFVFPSHNGRTHIDITSAWQYAVKQAGLEDFRFHDLRHSAASYLAMNGASLAEIAEVLGHKTLSMVKRYAHLSEQHVSKVVEHMNSRIFG